MTHPLVGEAKIAPEALATMRERGGTWAAYQNVDLGHPMLGHLKFLRYGEGCTFQEPPRPRLPDTRTEINWRYYYVGLVSIRAGEIIPRDPGPERGGAA